VLRVVGGAYRDLLDVFLVFVVAALPFFAVDAAMASLRFRGEATPPTAAVVSSVYAAISLPLYVAITSRLFQALADRVVGSRAADGAGATC
jgi:hypothetical protein